jgi:hypothetical protein
MNMVLLDVAVPLLQINAFYVIVLLIPVVGIEVVVVRRITHISWGRVISAVGIANALTTLLGFPIGWIFMRGVRAVTGKNFYGHSAFHFPWDEVSNSAFYDTWLSMSMNHSMMWLVYGCSLLLLVPTFFLSGWLEAWICKAILGSKVPTLNRAVWMANLASYTLLFLLMGWLAVDNATHVQGWQFLGTMNRPYELPRPPVKGR